MFHWERDPEVTVIVVSTLWLVVQMYKGACLIGSVRPYYERVPILTACCSEFPVSFQRVTLYLTSCGCGAYSECAVNSVVGVSNYQQRVPSILF